MLKKISALLCLTLSIVLFCMAVSATDAESTDINAIYVSGTATEGGTGVVSAPVSTLSEAYSLLENGGTIYLMDTVSVSVPEGDCFVAPAHTGKITITSADGYNGALDLTNVAHFHFGGETEWNNIGIIANDLVLSADNHCLTMGVGLSMSSETDGITYRGGHAYCDARIHLAAYAPCETANTSLGAAGSELYVHSGEYWSVSAWYGDTLSVSGGETLLYFGKRAENEEIWVRYLCPGLYSAAIDNELVCSGSTVSVVIYDGVNALDTYRFTKNNFSGRMTVNWLLHTSAQGKASAFIVKEFYPKQDATCTLNVYADQSSGSAKDCAALLMRGASVDYSGDHTGDNPLSTYKHRHEMYTKQDGRILCVFCEYEQCRHLTSVLETTLIANCQHHGTQQLRCTDLCGKLFGTITTVKKDSSVHVGNMIKSTYDPKTNRMGARCMGCGILFSYISGMPSADVYVAQNVGTPISMWNIKDHFAESAERIGTQEHPFQNFEDAVWYATVAAKQHGSVIVHILDDAYVPSDYMMPASSGHITITGGVLHFDGEKRYFRLSCDTTFEHLTFKTARVDTDYPVIISARNFNLTMGEGIVMGNDSTVPTENGFPDCNSVKMYVVGGFIGAQQNALDTNITIRSGDYWFVGGWNYKSVYSNDGKSHITIGKTNPNDKLQVFYLTPFSRGTGTINQLAEGTIVVDGDLYVKRFYITTLNEASTDREYVINVVLKGNISGYNEEAPALDFDLRGCPAPFPITTLNVYTDNRISTAVEDSYVFFGRTGYYSRDISLTRLNATVAAHSYEDYCANVLGGHVDSDSSSSCDECGYVIAQ